MVLLLPLVAAVPVIDMARIMSGEPSPEDIARVGAACRSPGFFNVVNHGMDPQILTRFEETMRAFFALPYEEKQTYKRTAQNSRGYAANEFTKQRRDVKEILDFGHVPDRGKPLDDPANRVMDGWNQVPADMYDALQAYYDACALICKRLLEVCALALGLPRRAFDEFFDDHTSFLRLNRYPVLSGDASRFVNATADLDRLSESIDDDVTPLAHLRGPRLGVNRHYDAGALTLLRQDDHVKGLQVNLQAHQGGAEWVDVDPVPGGFTVNVGDMLQVFSNDDFKAPEHRVLGSQSTPRFSAPFFLNPSYQAEIRPLGERQPRYAPFTWGHFRHRRFMGDFKDEGVPEIQIAHFLLESSGGAVNDTACIAP